MTFGEKLARLAQDRNRAEISRKAGLPPNAVSDYISKGYLPRVDTALALARQLNVSADWLADEKQGWPPPKGTPERSASDLTDQQLVHELARRFRGVLIDFLAEVERAKVIDWKAAALEAASVGLESPLPPAAKHAMHILGSVQAKFSRVMQDFDVQHYAMVHHAELPGADRNIAELGFHSLGFMWQAVEAMPYIRQFGDAVRDRREWQLSGLKAEADRFDLQTQTYVRAVAEQDATHRIEFEKRKEAAARQKLQE